MFPLTKTMIAVLVPFAELLSASVWSRIRAYRQEPIPSKLWEQDSGDGKRNHPGHT